MRARVGKRWPAAMAVAAIVLTGCSGDSEPDGEGAASAANAAEKAEAKSGGTVGGPGSACELPLTFDTAEKWTAEAVGDGSEGGDPGGTEGGDSGGTEGGDPGGTEGGDSGGPEGGDSGGTEGGDSGETGGAAPDVAPELAGLLQQGPVTLVCEIDAKPAGHVGFLRVWTGEKGEADPRAVLTEFLAGEDGVSKERYSTFSGDGGSGAEVAYLLTIEFLDETKKERAFAVTTPDGPVVVHLGGMDSAEHDAMIPAYELAKKTLKVAD
ncbi:lipoprotein [Streptomyces sp. NPDC088789]|uniref:lipoprotein n=1 Tax=Streptomyces sp. NPDC088789 TaxID=3365899 RepID=UPI003805039F